MPKYDVYILPRGRGQLATRTVNAPSLDALRRQASHWLEYGSQVKVKSPSGKVSQFTVRS